MSRKLKGKNNLPEIIAKIKGKREAYIRYDFSRIKNDILKTFFDLAQEFDSLNDYFLISVAVPSEFLQIETSLYLLDDLDENLEFICDSTHGFAESDNVTTPPHIRLSEKPYEEADTYVVPILGKVKPSESGGLLPVEPFETTMFGVLAVSPLKRLTKADKYFFEKYTGRIGYNLHNRLVARQNIKHLKFINNLVRDIEHNVIVPNMYFKHIFNQLKKRIKDLTQLENDVEAILESEENSHDKCEMIRENISMLRQKLADNHRELMEYHSTTSMFLESLFRKEHFQRGHLVLRPKKCLLEKEIIIPQLEYYHKRFVARNIVIERPGDMMGEEIRLMVDVGLLSQVYSNLFSNAVKYTDEVLCANGRLRKAVTYGREIMPDFFGPGKDGIKLNVFSTGEHIPVSDIKHLFSDGFRGVASLGTPGEGHGLSFIKNVVEIHGGIVGYEPTSEGNNFFLILPLGVERPTLTDSE